ncbi:MAG: OmpP1/FadL family transporter [Alphaproteobacteria bacterium]|nr:OmpP1/FadL family transporter [Alphaproteobacteria bacterium]
MKHMKTAVTSLSLVVLSASGAWASGYQLNQYSTTGLGRAFAGVGVVGDDFSAIAFNPAGMTLKGSGFQLGATTIQQRANVRGSVDSLGLPPDPVGPYGRMRVYPTLPHGFAQYKVNENVYLGIGVFNSFGLGTSYNADWFGRWHGTSSSLKVVDIAPAAAIKVNDQLSLGASVIARYVHGDLKNELIVPGSVNRMDLDGWEWAYNFGVMIEPIKGTRLGAAYQMNTAQTVTGVHSIRGTGGFLAPDVVDGSWRGTSTMKLPDIFTLSAHQKIGDKFGLSGSARWTKWNVFDYFILRSDRDPNPIIIDELWKNTWTFIMGLDYYHSPAWTFRTGLGYDPTPIRSPEYRTARIPDSRRIWTSIGASYKLNNFTVDMGFAHLFMRKASLYNLDDMTNSRIDARTSSFSNMFSLALQYDF